jgi:hypothetical protein
MAFTMQNEATAIGASLPVRMSDRIQDYGVEVILNSTGTTKITACTVQLQGGNENTRTCVSTPPVMAVGSTAARIANSAFYYQLAGTNYTIATDAVGAVITDINGTAITADVTGSKLGGVVVCANAAGAIRCITPDYGLTTTQAYNTGALCNAALDLVVVPSTYCYIGKAVITAAGGGFTFGSTALTGVVTFYDAYSPYYVIEAHVFTEAELTAQRAYFTVGSEQVKFVRTHISALTGAGKITVKMYPLVS